MAAVFPNGSDSWVLVGRKEPGSEPMKGPPDKDGLREKLEMLAYFGS